MPNPKVSVLIPTYNYAHYLPEAIESVLTQTFEDFELIIVDNCSTDNTEEIVNAYMEDDKRIKFMRNDENIGMYRNYNQALLLAHGEYIKFLNADDKFEPTLLEKFIAILDNDNSISIVTSYRQYFGSKQDMIKTPLNGIVEAKAAILSSLQKSNWIGEPTTVMFRRKNLNLGLFDISILVFADQDMWLRQLRVGNLYVIDEVLSYFRIHENQGTNQLSANNDIRIFNRLQYAEYRRNAILNNRFGYDLNAFDQIKIRRVLNASSKSFLKLMTWNLPNLDSLRYLYSFKYTFMFLLFSLIPQFIFSFFHSIDQMRKRIKYSILNQKK